MKREIKFRVRDAESKKVLGYEMFNTALNNGFCFYYADDEEETLHSEFSYPPMIKPLSKIGQLLRDEFTGLIDKNSKEIYEGDILRLFDDIIKETINVECFYWQEFCQFAFKNTNVDLNFLTKDEIEVIGNIYENPELL
jgi:uncharacterized phage protein (TIGR01671 family)